MITEYPYHKLVDRMHKIYKELILKNHDQDLTPLEANILEEVASGLADVTKHNILQDEIRKDTVIHMSDWQRSNLQKASTTAIEFGLGKILDQNLTDIVRESVSQNLNSLEVPCPVKP